MDKGRLKSKTKCLLKNEKYKTTKKKLYIFWMGCFICSACMLVSVVTFLYLVYGIGPGQSIGCFFGSWTVKALSHRLLHNSLLLMC